MEPLHGVFDAYRLDELDNNWINQVWDSQFVNMDNVPVDYLMFIQSLDMIHLLKQTCGSVKDFILKSKEQASWETLIAMNLDVRALLAVLTYLMNKGQATDADRDSRESCLRATSVYFVLLGIPGSDTFQAFHPVVFEIALKSLNLSGRLVPPSKKSSMGENNEQDESGERTLSGTQTVNLTKCLNGVMYELVTLLTSANLRLEIHSLDMTIGKLVELTKLANETVNNFKNLENRYEASLNSLGYNAYVGLYGICNREYAPIELITRIIGRHVLPVLCVGGNNKPAQLPVKQMTIIRESTINLIETLVREHAQSAQPALTMLIQHLMIKIPDRSEERQKQAIIVKKLINLCATSNDAFARSLRDLVLLSEHNKICYRIFAQEIIGKFLGELSDTRRRHNENEKNFGPWPASKMRKLLLATVLSRCVDVSSMVRGRAIATFAEYTESIEHPDVEEIFTFTRINSGKEMPSLDKLEEAIENNEMNVALPDLCGIIEMLRERGKDERALIRKSALQALRNGVLISKELLDNIKIMIRFHCRDTSLTVRKFAIRVLTTLLEKFPQSRSLRQDWVNFVMPRVFDSEGKVQDEVIDSLEKLTIGRMVTGDDSSSDDALPWSILKDIASNEMEDHLTKACDIWIKRKAITDEIIYYIKCHLGTKNDIEAWLLLASISENMSLPGMEEYCKYYERALNDTEDAFSSYLCLRVLDHSWPNFDDDSLNKIRSDLSERLNAHEIRVALTSLCIDIFYGITKRLENKPDIERTTMRDLMILSEAKIVRIMKSGDELENCSSVLFRAMSTMGHASLLCREKISTASLRTLRRFLVERNSLSKDLKRIKQLEGAAITVLAQQALLDRETAQQMTPIFGRLLRDKRDNSSSAATNINDNTASGPAVRINAAKALADICTKFTYLVEPYLPDMCVGMNDKNADVRQVILVIFIQLLVEDFIKINNGAFFFHILTMLADTDETIRQMTMFLIKERLLTKNKCLIAQQLVPSLFHFNGFNQSANLSRINYSRQLGGVSTLSGEENSGKRQIIYDFMLQHLDSSGKLAVFVTLTKQIFRRSNILGASVLQQINFNCEKGRCVLRDAIYIVSSDYLQPSSSGKQTNDEDNNTTEDVPRSSSILNSPITEAMKKHRLNVFLPSLVELKRYLAKKNSSLLSNVVELIDKTLADYNKDQLATFYNEYPKFEKELERDMRQYKGVACDRALEPIGIENSDESPPVPNKRPNAALDKNNSSLLINPDRTPRIVLRRLSTLTYPGISGWQTTPAHHSNPEPAFGIKISERDEKITQQQQKSLQSSPSRSRAGNSRLRESTKQHGQFLRDQQGAAMESSLSKFINTEPGEKLSSRDNSIALLDKSSLITSSDRVPRILLKRLSIDDYPRIFEPVNAQNSASTNAASKASPRLRKANK